MKMRDKDKEEEEDLTLGKSLRAAPLSVRMACIAFSSFSSLLSVCA